MAVITNYFTKNCQFISRKHFLSIPDEQNTEHILKKEIFRPTD